MSLLIQSELNGLLDLSMKEKGRMRKGNNLTYHCPFCRHRKRKMEVSLDTHEWHCWVCDAKGRSIHSLLNRMRVDDGIKTRLNKVLPHEAQQSWSPVEEVAQIKDLQLPMEFRSLLEPVNTISYKLAKQYAKKRRISKLDIIKYNIGYCDSGDYKDRLIFPSYGADNKLNFFTGRSYYDDVFLKYKNPEDVDRNIIGFENLVDFNYPIILCEGALDAIAIKRNAIPLFGKTMSNKLKLTLTSEQVSEIFIVLDDDAIKASIKIAQFLMSYNKVVHLVNLNGKDPNVLGFAEVMRQIRETPVLDFTDLLRLKMNL